MDFITILFSLLSAIIGGCIGCYTTFHVETLRENREAKARRADIANKITMLKPEYRELLKRFVVEKNPIFNNEILHDFPREQAIFSYLVDIGFLERKASVEEVMGDRSFIGTYTIDCLVADVYGELLAKEVTQKKNNKTAK